MSGKSNDYRKTEVPTLKAAKSIYRLFILRFRPYDIRILDTQSGSLYFLCVKKHECRKERRYWKNIEKSSDGGEKV